MLKTVQSYSFPSVHNISWGRVGGNIKFESWNTFLESRTCLECHHTCRSSDRLRALATYRHGSNRLKDTYLRIGFCITSTKMKRSQTNS